MGKTTKEMIAVMQAYADGKMLQVFSLYGNKEKWQDVSVQPTWDWSHFDYRVKPEPTIRPFTGEELLGLVSLVVRAKANGNYKLLISAGTESGGWVTVATQAIKPVVLLEQYEFLDGKPCGVVEA